MGAAAVMEDGRFPGSPAGRRQPRARYQPAPDHRCYPWSVLRFTLLANVAMAKMAVVGSLPPQQPPKSFAQNLDMLLSGGVTAGAAPRWRTGKLTGDAERRQRRQRVLWLLCVCEPAIGRREVVAAIGR